MSKLMSKSAAARIQVAEAKNSNGKVTNVGFTARAQFASSSNNPPPNGPSKTGKKSGKGRGNNPPKNK